MAEEIKKNQFSYHLLAIKDKLLILKIDLNASFTKACEILGIFGPERKAFVDKLVKDLNKGVITE